MAQTENIQNGKGDKPRYNLSKYSQNYDLIFNKQKSNNKDEYSGLDLDRLSLWMRNAGQEAKEIKKKFLKLEEEK